MNAFPAAARRLVGRASSGGRAGDAVLYGLCGLAALSSLVLLLAIAYEVVTGSSAAFSRFGLGFLVHAQWAPNFNLYGAGAFLYGTVVSSLMALLLALPIGVAIGIFLSMLAPVQIRGLVGPLVEMLAAIPSVILGFWGILVVAPYLRSNIEPWLHSSLGFIPIFGPAQTTGLSVFTAGLILTIMVVPIIASISRDLFLTVPRELQDGAAALGATRWESIRGVVLPTAASGVAAAAFLGLGRALGEAIAVQQVIGSGSAIHASLFQTGDTLASRMVANFPPTSKLDKGALFYLAAMLLAIGLITNLLAQWIGRRFDVRSRAA